MPRALKSKATKKPHKGGRAGKRRENDDHKVQKTNRHKRIKKVEIKKKNIPKETKIKEMRRIEKIEMAIKRSEHLESSLKGHIENLVKKEVGIKIVLLIPFNESANVRLLQTQIQSYINEKTGQQSQGEPNSGLEFKFPYFHFFSHPKQFPGLVKENFLFLSCDRNIQTMLDYAKVADVIVPVLSCKQTNLEGMNLNPYENAKAFDDIGYEQINALRQQGVLNSVCVLQDVAELPHNKQDKVVKLFQRFFQSEFQSDKMVATNNYDDIFSLLRKLQNQPETRLAWRDMRGYMLVQKISHENGTTYFEGFLKGNTINANQLVHITGMDDYQVEKIEILKSKSKLERTKQVKKPINAMQEELETNVEIAQYSTPNDEIKPLKESPADGQDLIDAFEGLTLSKPLMQEEQMIEENNIQDQESDISYDDQVQELLDDENTKKKAVMEVRGEEDLEFEDEAEYPVDTVVRDLYKDYQGLSSFRTTEVNKLQNLPKEYNTIYAFRSYQHTLKSAVKEAREKAFAHPGFYIRVSVKGIKLQDLQRHDKNTPLILSFLLKHERKMTQVHLRVRRNIAYPNQEVPVVSNKLYEVQLGFRKFTVKPIFSKILGGSQKTMYREQFVDQEGYYLCSFYHYTMYTPAPASIYRINDFTNVREPISILQGTLSKCDPMHVIMKRVILTGYPYKTNRRRAVVRYMFFNPKDVKYFKPVELKTKLGLRGNIEQSLGTHGLMKCLFNDMIKPHDTVCLYLYKRVFPQPWF